MDSLRYSASARLALWDHLPRDSEAFLSELASMLRDSSHGVLEAEHIEFVPVDNAALASVTAICDKIIARGNPTLIDLDFEHTLLTRAAQKHFRCEEDAESPTVGLQLTAAQLPFTPSELVSAAQELLCLPYQTSDAMAPAPDSLPHHLRELISEEEDLFLEQFRNEFGGAYQAQLHRQVMIRDLLLNDADDSLSQNYVDFVFHLGPVKWVIEVDGPQHEEPAQQEKDQARDALLRNNGWSVHRISTEEVRSGIGAWLGRKHSNLNDIDARALNANSLGSIKTAASNSAVHDAAFKCLLVPLAAQRCLRGLLHLYSNEVLDCERPQRVLIIEEDVPVAAEAFRMLNAIWTRIHLLAPETPAAPSVQLEVIGDDILPNVQAGTNIDVRSVEAPQGNYDVVLSHSFVLPAGYVGATEKRHLPNRPTNMVCIRRAIGIRTERSLQWCQPVRYDVADLERAISGETEAAPELYPREKRDALLFFLHLIFRKRDFWPGQLHVVTRLLQGKPAIVLLPTGGGKSLTYQFSGLLLPGMTLIIDPLVALMVDQVANLRGAGLDMVNFLAGTQDTAEKDKVLRDMGAGRLAFTFISPERLQIQNFRDQLQVAAATFPVSLAVIDEAHCVSEWGHDFRPSYLHMPRNLQRYCSDGHGHEPTLVGLTGTASFAVLTDMQIEMRITDEEAIILPKSFDRKELSFDVRSASATGKSAALLSLKVDLPRILRANPQQFYLPRGSRTNSGLVFCPHINGPLGVRDVAHQLEHDNYYSGGKPKKFAGDKLEWAQRKTRIQQDFKENRAQELVATKSFGMGIDKPNIRYTIHYTVPQSVEAFYQEAGRAGRNGKPGYARCTIIYSDDNWDTALELLNEPDHQQAMLRLNNVARKDRGDMLHLLWFLFNTFSGRSQDKTLALKFWATNLAPVIADMPADAVNTQEIKFTGGNKKGAELAIFRLMLLGVVQDYTIEWAGFGGRFAVRVKRIAPAQVKESLRRYLSQYKFDDFAESAVDEMPLDSLAVCLEFAIDVLIDFIYDQIVTKRKQALRTMGELCRNFDSDQNFRDAILAYLQESEFSDQLRTWVNNDFDAIGLEQINELLAEVTTLEEAKRLVGTTRRMLDEDPGSVALRYVSMCARAQSITESDSSVVQEATALCIGIDDSREDIPDPDSLFVAMLEIIATRRASLLDEIADKSLRRAGTTSLARRLLATHLSEVDTIYRHSLVLLTSHALQNAKRTAFYSAQNREETNA